MKKALYLLVLFPILAIGQTHTENFTKTITYKQPTTVSIANPTVDEAMVEINYFDGLGRPIQKVVNQQSSTGKNIVTHMEYDEFGRQVKEFMPFVGTDGTLDFNSSAGTDVINFYRSGTAFQTGNPDFEHSDYPYSQKELETSPLNRMYKQAAPGQDWILGSGHEMKMDYLTNTEIASEKVKYYRANAVWNATTEMYDASFPNASGALFYKENELYKTVTKNENWTSGNNNTTEEFKDKEGRMVLKRTYDAGNAFNTYYIYDQYGNLSFVLPPLASGIITTLKLTDVCYQYKYDYRNRLVAKKLPGKQWEYTVYNKLDMPVATGPAYSPWGGTAQGWMITKYDVFGRIVYTGWYNGDAVTALKRKEMAQNHSLTGAAIFEERTTNTTIDGVIVNYSNLVFPTINYKLLTINYYDSYNYPRSPSSIPTIVESQRVADKVKGMGTGSWVRFLDSAANTTAETTYTLFDDLKYTPISSYTQNHLGGFTQMDTNMDFSGKTIYSITKHKRTNSGTVPLLTLRDDYTYSSQDRLLTQFHTINTGTPQLIVQNSYDELGMLIGKNVGRTVANPLQKVNYNYNIRGWLKGINDTGNIFKPGDPTDLFAFRLTYNEPVAGTALYNGNISETFWKTNSDNTLRKYNYTYDNLNRLKDATYTKPGVSIANSYRENIFYDNNGNITFLWRNGNQDSNSANTNMIDDLIYTYKGNQLMKVLDRSNSPQGFDDDSIFEIDLLDDYSYDDNGNMTKDENKGISLITYNHLNLPTTINFDGVSKIEYRYNAKGQKLEKKVTSWEFSGIKVYKTEYLNGFQYKDNVLLFFPHAEGYVNNTLVSGTNTYNYVFNYTDHLGNIRLSYAQDPTNPTLLKTLEENHYYPFGLKHTNYNSDRRRFEVVEAVLRIFATPPSVRMPYQYKYNGKEYQDELGLNEYDYGARNYDPALGRFMNIDPLAETSRRYSPYAYALNNPVYFIDVDGMSAGIGGQEANPKDRLTYEGGHWSDSVRGINPDEETGESKNEVNNNSNNLESVVNDENKNKNENTISNGDCPDCPKKGTVANYKSLDGNTYTYSKGAWVLVGKTVPIPGVNNEPVYKQAYKPFGPTQKSGGVFGQSGPFGSSPIGAGTPEVNEQNELIYFAQAISNGGTMIFNGGKTIINGTKIIYNKLFTFKPSVNYPDTTGVIYSF